MPFCHLWLPQGITNHTPSIFHDIPIIFHAIPIISLWHSTIIIVVYEFNEKKNRELVPFQPFTFLVSHHKHVFGFFRSIPLKPPSKPHFCHVFPMFFPCFSHVFPYFPMFFPWKSHVFPWKTSTNLRSSRGRVAPKPSSSSPASMEPSTAAEGGIHLGGEIDYISLWIYIHI